MQIPLLSVLGGFLKNLKHCHLAKIYPLHTERAARKYRSSKLCVLNLANFSLKTVKVSEIFVMSTCEQGRKRKSIPNESSCSLRKRQRKRQKLIMTVPDLSVLNHNRKHCIIFNTNSIQNPCSSSLLISHSNSNSNSNSILHHNETPPNHDQHSIYPNKSYLDLNETNSPISPSPQMRVNENVIINHIQQDMKGKNEFN